MATQAADARRGSASGNGRKRGSGRKGRGQQRRPVDDASSDGSDHDGALRFHPAYHDVADDPLRRNDGADDASASAPGGSPLPSHRSAHSVGGRSGPGSVAGRGPASETGGGDAGDAEEEDPIEAVLRAGRSAMQLTPVAFVYTTRTTTSDVMAVTTTTTPFVEAEVGVKPVGALAGSQRRLNLPPKRNPVPIAAGSSGANAKKVRAMIKERDEFMERLKQEREARAIEENLAACRIQSVYRGFRVRPKAVDPSIEERRSRKAAAVREVDWHSTLASLTETMENHLAGGAPAEGDGETDFRKKVRKRKQDKKAKKFKKEAQYWSAVAVQTIARGYLARRAFALVRLNYERGREVDAAVKLQANYRGHQMRARMAAAVAEREYAAAVLVQSHWRGALARQYVRYVRAEIRAMMEQEVAASRIQGMYRVNQGRKEVQTKRETKAAVQIQKSARGRKARKEVGAQKAKKTEAATRVQAQVRGRAARKATKGRLDDARAKRQEDEAAVKIQSAARRRNAKKKVGAKRKAKREAEAKAAEAESKSQEAAAVKIQASARGRKSRKQVKEKRALRKKQHAAATDIQRVGRGYSSRRLVTEKRKAKAADEEKAALAIQSSARGRIARRKVDAKRKEVQAKKESDAAVGLQKVARSRKARADVAELRAKRREEQLETAEAAPRRRKRGGKRGSTVSSRRGSGPSAGAGSDGGSPESGGGKEDDDGKTADSGGGALDTPKK